MQVYIAKEGRQEGPYTIEYINSGVAAGRIKPTDLAWIQDWAGWQPVSALPDFVAAPSPPNMPPPSPPPMAGAARVTASSEHEALLRTFIGKNYEYYSRKWGEADQRSSKNTWNWAAFFLSLWWTAYRKLYRYAALLLGLFVFEVAGENFFGLPSGLFTLVNIGVAIAFGLQANRWYKVHAEQKLAEIAPGDRSDELSRTRLEQAGGTSAGAVVGFTAALIVFGLAIGFVAAAAHGQRSGTGSPGQSEPKDRSPKARTLAAWKTMQKIGYESQTTNPPKGRLDDPPSLKPNIRYLRGKAAIFSRINLDGVDSILTNHLSHRIAAYTRFADILENEYNDIIRVMQSLQRDAEIRHRLTELVTESDEEKTAAKFVELFAQLMADDEFQRQVEQIGQNYEPVMNEALEEAHRVDDEETATANALSEKYSVALKPRYYEGD